jgi:hypothetical protein
MMFFKAVFALYFATIALAIPSDKRQANYEEGTSCANPWPLNTRLITPT